MKFSPTETWLLVIAAVIAVFTARGLFIIIDDAVRDWRGAKEYRRVRRLALRQNINWLIVELIKGDDPGLDRALQDSLVEYRLLS